MTGFFQELAKKLAERWVALLVVPGVLFVVSAVLGLRLGHRHALDLTMATRYVSDQVTTIATLSGGAQAAVIVGLLAAASATGLVVQAMAGVTRRLFLGTWPWPLRALARRRAARRRTRWDGLLTQRRALENAHSIDVREPEQQQEIDSVAAKMITIAMAGPGRATWMGDRVHAVESVARDRHGLDLIFVWPRLWLVLPDTTRAEITAAHASFAVAVAAASWSWPLLLLGTLWWPAAVVGLIVGATGRVRAREAVGDLTALSESALDLHGRALATALGAAQDDLTGPLTFDEGAKVTNLVRKGR